MVMTDSVTESVSKVSGLSYKHESLTKMTVTKSVSKPGFSKPWGHSYKHESFTISDGERVCAGVCFW